MYEELFPGIPSQGEERRRKNTVKPEDAASLEKYCNRIN